MLNLPKIGMLVVAELDTAQSGIQTFSGIFLGAGNVFIKIQDDQEPNMTHYLPINKVFRLTEIETEE